MGALCPKQGALRVAVWTLSRVFTRYSRGIRSSTRQPPAACRSQPCDCSVARQPEWTRGGVVAGCYPGGMRITSADAEFTAAQLVRERRPVCAERSCGTHTVRPGLLREHGYVKAG